MDGAMQLIDLGPPRSAALNLAREECLFARLETTGPLLLFYVNTAAVVIGRNQNPWMEARPDALGSEKVRLVRRLSGGGAVYHDPGNLNYSLLLQASAHGRPETATILQPVIRALRSLGLPARLSARNAVFIDQYKVSGTAQFMTSGRILTHGTLLVDADLRRMGRCLGPDSTLQIRSRGRPSVASPVANLSDLQPRLAMAMLRRTLADACADTYGPIAVRPLDPTVKKAANVLAQEKYHTWGWNIGRSPPGAIAWGGNFRGAACRCEVDIRRGKIARVRVEHSSQWQPDLQRWASDWLQGHRLGGNAIGRDDGPRGEERDATRAHFRRWLKAGMPKPIRFTGQND